MGRASPHWRQAAGSLVLLVGVLAVVWSWFGREQTAHAAVAFRAASPAVAAGSGNISLAMPAGTVPDDVMVAAIVARDNVVVTLPAGWTKFNELNNGTGLRSTMAWKRAGAGESGPYTVTHAAGNAIIGVVASYSGVVTTGNPVEAASTRANASSLTTTADAAATVSAGALVIFTSHYGNDFSAGHGNTPYTCASGPAAFAERVDAETTLGNDASLALADASKTPPGSTGTCTEAMTGTAAVNIGALTVLTPEAVTNTVTVSAAVAQPAAVTEGQTAVVLGGFALLASSAPATLTAVTFNEEGSVSANLHLTNARLYAEAEATCTFAGASPIGTPQSFNALDQVTFSGLALAVGTAAPQCLFLVVDVGSAAGGGSTVEVEVTAAGDVALTGATAAGTFPVQASGTSNVRVDQGTVRSSEVDFDWVSAQPSWGAVVWTTTEPAGDVTLRLRYTATTPCDTLVPEGALPGNAAGFDASQSPLDISSLSPLTYNRLCLEATLVAGANAAPTLNDWTVTWETAGVATSTQAAYRWYQNDDATTVTTALAGQDTPASLTAAAQAFRLRLLIHVDGATLAQSAANFKLQLAARVGTCDAAFSGESYVDVTTATPIAFRDNSPPDGAALTANPTLDPDHSGHPRLGQTYEEANPFTNSQAAIGVGQDGLWDFALTSNAPPSQTSYCFRVVNADSSPLASYGVVAELTTSVIYVGSGTYVSNAFNLGAPRNFGVVEWRGSVTNPPCPACTLRLQLQTAPDAGGAPGTWSLWSGPEGEDGDETDFFTVAAGELIHADHNGDQWVRYRVFLEGDADHTPVLEEVRLGYK